jgi:hypothetical protein
MLTANQAVEDGTSRKLSNEELGLICRRINEIERRIIEGTLSKNEALAALQTIVEGKAGSFAPCKLRHRSEATPFKRPPINERRKSLAPLRLRSKDRLNRLYYKCKLAMATKGHFPKQKDRLLPEDIIVHMWEAENIPRRGIDYGRVPLQSIVEPEEGEVSEHDTKIVANTIQWLGTNNGREFIRRFILAADLHI